MMQYMIKLNDTNLPKSKSQIKRDMLALQELGEKLPKQIPLLWDFIKPSTMAQS
jgi:ribosomal 50S subunit-associated protein YjgA (DUF615 family)